jgi:hypothetical protein
MSKVAQHHEYTLRMGTAFPAGAEALLVYLPSGQTEIRLRAGEGQTSCTAQLPSRTRGHSTTPSGPATTPPDANADPTLGGKTPASPLSLTR